MVHLPRMRTKVPHRFFFCCFLLSWSILIMMRDATMNPAMGTIIRT